VAVVFQNFSPSEDVMRAPAVFLMLLLLSGCREHEAVDFEQAWNAYKPARVSGADDR
jgi:hypothetical protein